MCCNNSTDIKDDFRHLFDLFDSDFFGFSSSTFFISRVMMMEMEFILKKRLVLIRNEAANEAWKFDKWD